MESPRPTPASSRPPAAVATPPRKRVEPKPAGTGFAVKETAGRTLADAFKKTARLDHKSILISAAAHSVIIIILLYLTIELPSTGGKRAELIATVLDPPKNVFESKSWTVEMKPAIRPPGGGALRSASSKALKDTTKASSSGESLLGLENADSELNDLIGGKGDNANGNPDAGDGVAEGLGGGNAEGIGQADFFGAAVKGQRIVYVIDGSKSMDTYKVMLPAKLELRKSLDRLAPQMEFEVIIYNDDVKPLDLRKGRLVPANPAYREKAKSIIMSKPATGGSDHRAALKKALDLRPDVIFFLSDCDGLKSEMVDDLTRVNNSKVGGRRPASIHIIQFHFPAEFLENSFKRAKEQSERLASANNGSHRVIDTSKLVNGE